MTISLTGSTPQLLLILAAVIIVGLILRHLSRRRYRAHPRPARPARKAPRSTQSKRSATIDHGARVAQKYGLTRSPEWPALEREHLQREPACRACGYRGRGVQVHHIKPFHLYPQLELDPNNLITLCEVRGRDHHLLLGHLDDWESYNPNVREDVKRFHGENAKKLKANPIWQQEKLHRPQPRASAV
jgi:5-methylcytosine-specific restriction endonuclease McrA